MRPRALLPHATLAIAIVVASSVAVLSTAREGGVAPAPTATAVADATGAPRAIPDLSKTGRLAFWREGKLWVSNLDGSLRRAIAQIDDMRRISLTRWSTDGGAIAFVDAGVSLVVAGTDGSRVDVDVPLELRDGGYRIADVRWAPDSKRVAATLLRPGDGRSDAFLADLSAARPTWTRVTQLDDLFVADWISGDELLAHTAGGVVGIVRTGALNAIRPISGALGASPIVAQDGRIHFLTGRVPVTRDPTLPYITVTRATIWSAAADGGDVRPERTIELNDVRLDGRLPDGRYLVHRGSSTAQAVTGGVPPGGSEDVESLPANAGIVERVRITPDGRSAYGFTRERIVRLDLAKIAATPPATPGAGVNVFLDTSGEADVWFPSSLSVVRGNERPPATPAARYAFPLGGHLWSMGADGVPGLLRSAPPIRRTNLPMPRWSPTGDHILAIEQAGPAFATTALVAIAIDRSGNATRLATTLAAARSFAWAPGGGEVAVVVDRRGINGTASDAQLEVRFVDPSGRTTRPAVAGREVTWTARGILVLRADAGVHTMQLLEGEGAARTFVTRERLAADPRASASTTSSGTRWNDLDASPDGSFASVRLQTQDSSVTRNFFVVLGGDGAPLAYLRGDNLADPAWSPAKPLLGYTLDIRTVNERAVVHDPATGELLRHDGRFAGWSRDGEWYFVGRTTGLFAYPVSGYAPYYLRSTGIRVAPIGLPVAITAAR